MTYTEAMEYQPSLMEIRIELKKHNIEFAEYEADFGNQAISGAKLLAWLGY